MAIATFNRAAGLRRLLAQLGGQTLDPASFEVVVVDDGSMPPVDLSDLRPPFPLRVLAQANAGAAAARHAAVMASQADLLVLIDDDMEIPEHFLAVHLACHRAAEPLVVLGHIRPDPSVGEKPLFERYHARAMNALAEATRTIGSQARGVHLYTGNVSFRRADYLQVGGFDATLRRSEDVELGARLERAGVRFAFAEDAYSFHHSDHASPSTWRKVSGLYGRESLRIAHKHPDSPELHPYEFFRKVSPVSRPLLALSLAAPRLGNAMADASLRAAGAIDQLRLEGPALKATALAYGLDFFAGVGREAGGPAHGLLEIQRYLAARAAAEPTSSALAQALAAAASDLAVDHAAASKSVPTAELEGDASVHTFSADVVQRIGLQMMAAYRLMRALRRSGHLTAAKVVSRLIRHVYGADLHWNAELAPGVHIVHGMGMAISGRARVGPGSVLSHHVTLGEGLHPSTRKAGAPSVGAGVHIGPGATLVGPISIGDGSKIMAGALVLDSVPPDSLVEVQIATSRPRPPRTPPSGGLAPRLRAARQPRRGS